MNDTFQEFARSRELDVITENNFLLRREKGQ